MHTTEACLCGAATLRAKTIASTRTSGAAAGRVAAVGGVLAGMQKCRGWWGAGGMGLGIDRVDQRVGLGGVERRIVVGEDGKFLLGRAAIGHGMQPLALEIDGDGVAGA